MINKHVIQLSKFIVNLIVVIIKSSCVLYSLVRVGRHL